MRSPESPAPLRPHRAVYKLAPHITCLAKLESQKKEAEAGIEPANRGFADLGLTTWLPRRN